MFHDSTGMARSARKIFDPRSAAWIMMKDRLRQAALTVCRRPHSCARHVLAEVALQARRIGLIMSQSNN